MGSDEGQTSSPGLNNRDPVPTAQGAESASASPSHYTHGETEARSGWAQHSSPVTTITFVASHQPVPNPALNPKW